MDFYYQTNSASNCSKGFKKLTKLIKALRPTKPDSVIYSYLLHCNFDKSILEHIQSTLNTKYATIPNMMKECLDGLEKNECEKQKISSLKFYVIQLFLDEK